MRHQNGFTLVEMMIVVIIIGVLAGIAVPLYSKAVERARISEAVDILGTIRDAEMRYALEFGDYSDDGGGNGDLSVLDMEIPAAGKYFVFTSYGNGGPDSPDPLDGVDERIAVATRSGVDAGVYTAGYQILVNETGGIWSLDSEVAKLFN